MLRTRAPIRPLALSMTLYNGTMSAVGGRTRTRMMAYKNGRFHQAWVRDSAYPPMPPTMTTTAVVAPTVTSELKSQRPPLLAVKILTKWSAVMALGSDRNKEAFGSTEARVNQTKGSRQKTSVAARNP